MQGIISFVQAHGTISALVAYYVISAAIGALPAPQTDSSRVYLFFYKFFNTLGGNLTRAFATKVEGSPNWDSAVQKAKDLGAAK